MQTIVLIPTQPKSTTLLGKSTSMEDRIHSRIHWEEKLNLSLMEVILTTYLTTLRTSSRTLKEKVLFLEEVCHSLSLLLISAISPIQLRKIAALSLAMRYQRDSDPSPSLTLSPLTATPTPAMVETMLPPSILQNCTTRKTPSNSAIRLTNPITTTRLHHELNQQEALISEQWLAALLKNLPSQLVW